MILTKPRGPMQAQLVKELGFTFGICEAPTPDSRAPPLEVHIRPRDESVKCPKHVQSDQTQYHKTYSRMAQSEEFRACGNTLRNGQTGNDLRGLGDWHVRTLSLYDGHQQNKRQVSMSAANRYNQNSLISSRQEWTPQSQVDKRGPGLLFPAYRTRDHHTADTSSRSHQCSTHPNRIVGTKSSPELPSMQRSRAPSAVPDLNRFTRDLYVQGKQKFEIHRHHKQMG